MWKRVVNLWSGKFHVENRTATVILLPGVKCQDRFTDCGGELVGNGEVQFLAAPGYPDADADPESTYPDNAYCEWTYPGNDDTFFGVSLNFNTVELGYKQPHRDHEK